LLAKQYATQGKTMTEPTQTLDANGTLVGQINKDHKYKVAANGIWARVFLAFLTTAGIFYINIMPAVVTGLKQGLGFTTQQAGFVSSANLYGASIGALVAVFIIKKINWRSWSYILLGMILAIDLMSVYVTNPNVMVVIRALHGLTGGLLVGIGFAIISRTSEPDKTFGYLLFIQWGLGGLGLMFIPNLVPLYGVGALFYSLMAFTLVSLCMLPFLTNYPVNEADKKRNSEQVIKRIPLFFTLFGIFLFQAANMGLFAYMIGIGKVEGLTLDFMSPALGMASWIALVGAFAVMVIGTKLGRAYPLLFGIIITALCSWLLHYSEIPEMYSVMNFIIGITWAFVLPYLFGMCAEFDKAGQYAAMGGFASKMGLASGPMVVALVIADENYSGVINLAAVALIACAIVVFKPARLLDKG
jgi:predicted MFS family arabinose efflux permease